MLLAPRSRILSLVVLAAYFAAHTLGALLHEQLHHHPAGAVCCHGNHDHEHTGHRHGRPADDRTPADGLNITGTASVADHACIVCRLSGQPVVPTAAIELEVSASVCTDTLPSPAAAPLSIAVRIAQSRAPPAAV